MSSNPHRWGFEDHLSRVAKISITLCEGSSGSPVKKLDCAVGMLNFPHWFRIMNSGECYPSTYLSLGILIISF